MTEANPTQPEGYEHPVRQSKLDLIDVAHRMTAFRSFADLGGCWGVNGAYAFRAAELCGPGLRRSFILDGAVTQQTREEARRHPQIECVETLLGAPEAFEAVGEVDAVIMFDVLLHQVNPDWDDFLIAWAGRAKALVIYNQNWLRTPHTIRFVDRGLDWYRRNVFVWEDANPSTELAGWFDRHHERDANGRLERDSHDFWQWGIRPLEIVNLLALHGFELVHMTRDGMPFGPKYPWMVNDGMVFRKARYPDSSRLALARNTLRSLRRGRRRRSG